MDTPIKKEIPVAIDNNLHFIISLHIGDLLGHFRLLATYKVFI